MHIIILKHDYLKQLENAIAKEIVLLDFDGYNHLQRFLCFVFLTVVFILKPRPKRYSEKKRNFVAPARISNTELQFGIAGLSGA